MAKVAVIMPSFNRPTFVEESIKHIQAQTLKDFKLYIMDNSSKQLLPRMTRVYEKFSDDPRIFVDYTKIIDKDRYVKKGEVFLTLINKALFEVSEDEPYIAFSCDDVFMLPRKLQMLSGLLDSHGDCGVAGGVMEIISWNTPKEEELGWTPEELREAFQSGGTVLGWSGGHIRHPTGAGAFDFAQLLVRRDAINKIGYLKCIDPDTGKSTCLDAEICIRISKIYGGGACGVTDVLERTFVKTRGRYHREPCEKGEIME